MGVTLIIDDTTCGKSFFVIVDSEKSCNLSEMLKISLLAVFTFSSFRPQKDIHNSRAVELFQITRSWGLGEK
jgi:hypothetical protein